MAIESGMIHLLLRHSLCLCLGGVGGPVEDLRALAVGSPVNVAAVARVGARDHVFSGHDDGLIRVWDRMIWAPATFAVDTRPVLLLATVRVAGEPLVVSGHDDGPLRTWSPSSGDQVGELTGAPGATLALATIETRTQAFIVYAHIDEYEKGTGNLQKAGTVDQPVRWLERGDIDAVLVVLPFRVELQVAGDAAEKLAGVALDVLVP